MATSNKTYARLASLIGKLQDGLTNLRGRHESLTTFVGGLRGDVVTLKESTATTKVQNDSAHASLVDQIDRVAFQNNKREEAQTLRDQSNVQSLVNLRDSTAKAFTQVAADIKTMIRNLAAVNDRVAKLEFQNSVLIDSLTEQEQRIENLEALITKYEDLRKAQAELARVNGSFL